MIAKVILNNKEQNIDKTFDYLIPDMLLQKVTVGMRVKVPFGVRNNLVEGIVIDVKETSEFKRLKAISSVIGSEPICTPKILELCLWISRKYFCTLYQASFYCLQVRRHRQN